MINKPNKCLVIAGFAGIGKTTLAKKYSNVIDLESSKYKYDYEGVDPSEYEKLKGNKDRKPNKDYPQNYINAILDAQTKYDIVLVWLHPKILAEYDKNGIDYILCYPSLEAFKNYKTKLINRGNSTQFVDELLNLYPKRYKEFNALPNYKLELAINETLEDKLIQLGFNLIKNNIENNFNN